MNIARLEINLHLFIFRSLQTIDEIHLLLLDILLMVRGLSQ